MTEDRWVCSALNEPWSLLVQSPPALLRGEPIGALLPDRLIAEALGRLCDVAALTATPRRLATPVIAGRSRWARAVPVPAEADGAPPDVRLTLDDLEDAPPSYEQMREILQSQSPELVATFDRSLRVTGVNETVCLISGLSREQIIGRTNREMGYPEMIADLWDSNHLGVLESGKPRRVSYQLLTVLGVRPYESLITPRFDDQGRVVEVEVFSREVADGAGSGLPHEVSEDLAVWARFDPLPSASTAARRQVAEWLIGAGLPEFVDKATLAVSELATNAVMHAGSEFYVHARHVGDCLRIEVRDGVHTLPIQRPPGSVGGRGLHLVSSIAIRWGADVTPCGKVVWCDLRPEQDDAPDELSVDALLSLWSDGQEST